MVRRESLFPVTMCIPLIKAILAKQQQARTKMIRPVSYFLFPYMVILFEELNYLEILVG